MELGRIKAAKNDSKNSPILMPETEKLSGISIILCNKEIPKQTNQKLATRWILLDMLKEFKKEAVVKKKVDGLLARFENLNSSFVLCLNPENLAEMESKKYLKSCVNAE